jgi:hypothetical protein
MPLAAKTGSHTIGTGDYTVTADATTGDLDINLPAASAQTGRIIVIKRLDNSGNEVRVVAQAGDDIDANQHYFLDDQWDSITVQSTGSDWVVIAEVKGAAEPSSSSSL